MKIKFPSIKKDVFLLIYKLLYDALALSLLTFAFLMITEGVLPGLISEHLSFTKVLVVIFSIIASTVWIGKKYQITYAMPKLKGNKFLPALIIFIFLLIGNSLLKFALWQNIVITITALAIFYLFYELFFEE